MENQPNSKSIILNNGLYLGIIGVFVSLILWATGNGHELQWVNSVVGFVAMITLIILGIKKFKQANGGYISWGQGVKIGLGIAMISAVITVVYTLLFMNVIDPSFQEQAMEIQQQKWLDGGMTEEQIETFTESAKNFQGPGVISAMILAFSAFVGFIISAVIAAIMKKSEEENY